MKHRTRISIVLRAAVWLVVFQGCGGEKEPWPAEPTSAARDPAVVTVTVEEVTYRPVQRTVEAVGTLHGYEEVTISAKVEGPVIRIHHDVADRVKPGELLLEVDPTDYELAVRQAEKALQVELAKLGLDQPPAESFDLTQLPTVVQARARMDNSRVRFERYNLMTTVMLIAAMIPIALGQGPGAGARASMAKVIIGGQLLSLLLALLVTPVTYSLFDSLSILFARLWLWRRKPHTAHHTPLTEPPPQI